MYSKHGKPIQDREGFAIEAGTPLSPPVNVYGPGVRVKNYTLYPSDDLTVLGSSTTVDKAHTLRTLLKKNAGICHWAACR
ncbi:hypothetical protein GCM10010449_38730 [Streptomyces rectiviolaceus]|uniref:Putative adhesin Stv domain-containing protein n=2 Tax=Streptomyces rectiviolaceus TaxID=332591 RepID=A0ABP6MJ03_9ACTN